MRWITIGATLVATAVAWFWLGRRLDAAMATLPVFVATWTVMMAAMMLPSLLPSVLLFGSVSQSRVSLGFRPVPAPVFATGYFLAWALLGLGVAVGGRVLTPLLGEHRRWVAAAALALAGAYQLTRLKARCLAHCRSPLHFFMHHWHDGPAGALRVGVHHGFYCIGCCAGLMLALITLGMMTPGWMVAVSLVILIEKVAPGGDRAALGFGVLLLLLAVGAATGLLPLGAPMDMPMDHDSMGDMRG